jgi:hypothetical protein
MESRQLLISVIPFTVSPQQINESLEKNGGRLIVSGVLQRANAVNQNGRVYPKPVLLRESDKYAKTFVIERRALGELDHPDSTVVNLSNASHNVQKMWWEGDDLCGTVEILGTPAGNILKELFKSGIRLGISSRGLGSVKEAAQKQVIVQDDFELIAFDFVSNPSTQGAFLSPINEGAIKERINSRYHKVNDVITNILLDIGK